MVISVMNKIIFTIVMITLTLGSLSGENLKTLGSKKGTVSIINGIKDVETAYIQPSSKGINLNTKAYDLYSKGYDLYSTGKYLEAINYFSASKKAGYDPEENNRFILICIDSLGYDSLSKGKFEDSISYYKLYLANKIADNVLENLLYSYIQLSQVGTDDKSLAMALHGYKAVDKYQIRNDNVKALAITLANIYKKNMPLSTISDGLALVLYALEDHEAPYLHQTAGVLYELQMDTKNALKHYDVIINNYKNTDFFPFSNDRYRDLQTNKALVEITYEILLNNYIKGDNDRIELLLEIPQEHHSQKVDSLYIEFNNKNSDYTIEEDSLGNRFARVIVNSNIEEYNTVTVKGIVKKEAVRSQGKEFKSIKISDYNNKSSSYIDATSSNEFFPIEDSVAKRDIDKIKKDVKSNRLVDILDYTFNYVIDDMNYNLNTRNKALGFKRVYGNNYDGNCEDYAVYLTTLLRGLGIPSEVYKGETIGKQVGHAWSVIFTPDGEAITMDATWSETCGLTPVYKYYDSGLNITVKKGYNSEIMYGNENIQAVFKGQGKIKLGNTTKNIVSI